MLQWDKRVWVRFAAGALQLSFLSEGELNMKMIGITASALLLALFISPVLFAQDDVEGSKDHPLFNRMPEYYISDYNQKDFDSFDFEGKNGRPVAVEGRYTHIFYRSKEWGKNASGLQIGRNYQNAVTKIGGEILFQQLASGGGFTT